MSEVIATAEFQGETLAEITLNALAAFEALVGGEQNYRDSFQIVIGPAEVSEILATMADRTVVRLWSATCHLVSKETAT